MRSFFKLFVVRWLLALLVAPGICSALDPTPMQRSVAALIQSKAAQRGISASDPRLNPTMNAIGSSVAGTAAAAAVARGAQGTRELGRDDGFPRPAMRRGVTPSRAGQHGFLYFRPVAD